MQFLLVLVLCGAQLEVPELVPQAAPGAAQEVAPGDGPGEFVPNGNPPLPGELAPAPGLQDGPLMTDEPQEFMAPDGTGDGNSQHHEPPHHGPRPHFDGGPVHHGPGPVQHGPGCMPGPHGAAGCQPQFQSFAAGSSAGDGFSECQTCQTGPVCQTCQDCQSGCYPPVGCHGCRPGCPLFGCWHLCCCCDPCTRKRLQAKDCHTTGDMYPESPYFPVNHGNYYFRPYHWAHVAQQQSIAATWGADPRAPYQSDLFCHIYSEIGIPLPDYTHESMESNIPPRDRKPSDYFTTVP